VETKGHEKMGFTSGKRLGYIAAAALGATGLLPAAAFSADLDDRWAGTYDTVIYWGADGSLGPSLNHGYGADIGFATALNGDIGVSGWTMSGNFGLGRSASPAMNTDSIYASLLLGRQWHAPGYYFSLSAGLQYVNNAETPGGGITDGSRLGAIFQYGFETKSVDNFYLQSYGAYSTANSQIYGHVKAGYKAKKLRFGAEFTVSDDIGGPPVLRYGAFVGDIPLGEKLSMTVSAGYQQDLAPAAPGRFYAGLGFVVPLSFR